MPGSSALSSVVLTTKYPILDKIVIVNWLPRLYISSISKELVVLLYVVGTSVSFDLTKVIFQVVVSNVEFENIVGVLPFPYLIYELLKIQKKDLDGVVYRKFLEILLRFLLKCILMHIFTMLIMMNLRKILMLLSHKTLQHKLLLHL